MKLRISGHTGNYGFLTCTRQTKKYAEFNNVSPSDIQTVLSSGIEPERLSIPKRYYEYFPELKTF